MTSCGNILIVDDEVGPIESMRMILKPYHHIDTANSGKTALQMMAKHSFDVITLDLDMKDMHGMDVLKKIKEGHEEVEVVIVTGYGTLTTAQQAIRYGVYDYITKPFNVSEIIEVINNAVRKKLLQLNLRNFVTDLLRNTNTEKLQRGVEEILEGGVPVSLQDAFLFYRDLSLMDFIKVLSKILEEKSPSMHYHSVRVDRFSRVIAEEMGLSKKERDYLTIAAFLHDIGKVGINNSTLNKAGKLSDHEWEEMREHPTRGVELVKPLCLPEEILSIILHHHESYDGGGYPHGLKGEEIPLCARIIRIIDSYDAMISNRPYRKALPLEWVIQELQDCAGSDFDPDIVEIFIRSLQNQDGLVPLPSCRLSN